MGWNIITPHQHHECQLPNYEERKEASIVIGTMIECDECGTWWVWQRMMADNTATSVAKWQKRAKCCSS